MKVEKLTLKNFRNIQNSSFYSNPTVNFIVGPNGQGKTSFLEALGFLSTLRSFRDAKPLSVIQWGSARSEVSCQISMNDSNSVSWDTELSLVFQMDSQKVTKTAFINQKPYRSSAQYLSQRFGSYQLGFHSVIFNPSDHDLVRSDPTIRRSYLDRIISAEDIEYLKTYQKYQRALAQRNALLKSNSTLSSKVLFEFTQPLCEYGVLLISKRLHWILKALEPLNLGLQKIAPGQPELRMAYFSQWLPEIENLSFNNNKLNTLHFAGQGHLPSLKLLEQSFWVKSSMLESLEKRAGHSLIGPHRDDWGFFLGNQALKAYGSQGEVRSVLLALKLSEIDLFRRETGHRPLFLLDDFSSELDRERRLFLLQYLTETDLQTFVTTTEDTSFIGKRFWVNQGRIEEGKQ